MEILDNKQIIIPIEIYSKNAFFNKMSSFDNSLELLY